MQCFISYLEEFTFLSAPVYFENWSLDALRDHYVIMCLQLILPVSLMLTWSR